MSKIYIDLSHVDWKLLRSQKQTLTNVISTSAGIQSDETTEALTGLLHLLDHIQDQAAEIIGEETVFGNDLASDETDSTPCPPDTSNPNERRKQNV